jgi:hypothetical protein
MNDDDLPNRPLFPPHNPIKKKHKKHPQTRSPKQKEKHPLRETSIHPSTHPLTQLPTHITHLQQRDSLLGFVLYCGGGSR